MGKGYRRRNYFIDTGYQGRFVFAIIGICAAGMILSLGLFNFLSYRGLDAYLWKIHADKNTAAEIIMPYLIYANVPALILTVSALAAFACFMILRTAPPVFRMTRFIDTASSGNLAANLEWVAFDEFRETADELNQMIAVLRERFGVVKERGDTVIWLSSIIPYVSDNQEAASEKCDALIRELEGLKSSLAALKSGA